MKHAAPLVAVLLVAASGGAAVAASDDEVRSFEHSFEARALERLDMDFPIGELQLIGSSGDRVEVQVTVECSDGWRYDACVERADRIRLEDETSGDALALWFAGYSSWRSRGMSLDVVVRLPSRLDLSVDMNIGELEIEGVAGDLTVDMSIGEVSVRMAESAIREVRLDTGIGETSLRTTERRSGSAGLFTREVRWNAGGGDASVRIELGIGEVDVRLR